MLWIAIITTLCFLPGKSIPGLNIGDLIGIDKIAHFGLYFILIFLICLDTVFPKKFIYNTKGWLIILAAIFYSLMIEIVQEKFLSDRYFDILDLIANIGGCFVAPVIFNWVLKQKII